MKLINFNSFLKNSKKRQIDFEKNKKNEQNNLNKKKNELLKFLRRKTESIMRKNLKFLWGRNLMKT